MAVSLPSELWREIFELAIGDEDLLYPDLVSSRVERDWFEGAYGVWMLREPRQALQSTLRQTFVTKKVGYYGFFVC